MARDRKHPDGRRRGADADVDAGAGADGRPRRAPAPGMGRPRRGPPNRRGPPPPARPQPGVRPLLVVLMEFTDVAHDSVLTPAFIRNQIFGPRPSVNDYYLETSYGPFSFSDQGSWAWIT